MNKVLGYYDDTCEQCGKEQTAAIYYVTQDTWECYSCEYDNAVAEVK